MTLRVVFLQNQLVRMIDSTFFFSTKYTWKNLSTKSSSQIFGGIFRFIIQYHLHICIILQFKSLLFWTSLERPVPFLNALILSPGRSGNFGIFLIRFSWETTCPSSLLPRTRCSAVPYVRAMDTPVLRICFPLQCTSPPSTKRSDALR